MRYLFTGLGALLLISQSLLAQPALFTATPSKGNTPALAARTGERTRRVHANAGVLRESEILSLNLFDDRRFQAHRGNISTDGQTMIWTGQIEGRAGSEVTLVLDGDRITGSIRTADGIFFSVRPEEDGTHSIAEVDASAVHIDDEAVEPPAEMAVEEKAGLARTAAASASNTAAYAVTKSIVDLLVVYTPEARSVAGSTANMVSRIQLAIAETNQGFVNSGIDMELRLVGTSETGPSAGQAASNTYLNQVTSDTTISALRNQYGADMVSVWVNGPGAGGGVVGIGWIQTRPSTGFSYYAFSVVEVNFAAGPYYSFAHELGHNLGGVHDRANAGATGAYPYAYGYQQQAGGFVDIMAYTGGCSGCRRVNYFSNPDVSLNGYPTGVVSTAADAADLRLTLNSTRTFAEQWRAAVTAPTAAVTSRKCELRPGCYLGFALGGHGYRDSLHRQLLRRQRSL